MQRQRVGGGGSVVFRLVRDTENSPYRYRGVSVFSVTVALSWLDADVSIVDGAGRLWMPTWAQFAASLPEIAGAGAGVVVSVVLDAPAVAWAPSAARDAKRVQAHTTARAAWPGQIEAIRAEWLPRRKTDRRTGYLAAADALQRAIEFDQARGAA